MILTKNSTSGEWEQVAGGVSNSYAPIGSYLAMKDNSVKPQGYLLSDGRDTTGTDDELSTKYPLLYAYLGNTNILPAELDHSVLGAPEDISTNLNHTTNSSYYTSPYDGVVIINWTPADRYKSMYWSDDGTNWTEFVHNLDTSTYQTATVPVKKGDRLYLRDNIADNVIYARFYKQYKYIKAKDVNLSGGTQTLADRVETLETTTSGNISGATTNSGTITSATYARSGNVVQLRLTLAGASATTHGNTTLTVTMPSTVPVPVITVDGVANIWNGSVDEVGHVRMSSGSRNVVIYSSNDSGVDADITGAEVWATITYITQ